MFDLNTNYVSHPEWTTEMEITSKLPIDLSLAKPYVLADVPFNEGKWTRVFEIDDQIIVIRLRQDEVLSQEVQLEIEAEQELNSDEINAVVDRIRYECGLDETLNVIREERKNDILMDIAVKTNPGFRLYANSNILETAVMAILNQNMDFTGFQYMKEKFMLMFGTPVPWDDKLRLFPHINRVASISREEWIKLGVTTKLEYLIAFDEKDWKKFETYAHYPIYERGLEGMEEIQGIGPYTSRQIMIYGMRRYDKAFIDAFVQEILEHKFKLATRMPLSEFDLWVKRRWSKDPALIMHAHIQEYFPEYLRSLDLDKLRQEIMEEL